MSTQRCIFSHWSQDTNHNGPRFASNHGMHPPTLLSKWVWPKRSVAGWIWQCVCLTITQNMKSVVRGLLPYRKSPGPNYSSLLMCLRSPALLATICTNLLVARTDMQAQRMWANMAYEIVHHFTKPADTVRSSYGCTTFCTDSRPVSGAASAVTTKY